VTSTSRSNKRNSESDHDSNQLNSKDQKHAYNLQFQHDLLDESNCIDLNEFRGQMAAKIDRLMQDKQ
jgi:hypothetical protein